MEEIPRPMEVLPGEQKSSRKDCRPHMSPCRRDLSCDSRLSAVLELVAYTLLGCLCSLGKLPLRTGAIRKSETSESPNLLAAACSGDTRENSVG